MINSAILHFLLDLSENNNREWFAENKSRYKSLTDEFELFVQELIHRISLFDPSIGGITPKDSMYRIYRDVRFSHDKSPFKNHIGTFISPGGKNSEYAGYYFHLEPGASFLAGGLYCPQPLSLKAVRETIDTNYLELQDILSSESFTDSFGSLQGDCLKTTPKGFPKDHPAAELLKFKSYTFIRKISDDDLLSANLLETLSQHFAVAAPLNAFLNQALGYRPAM